MAKSILNSFDRDQMIRRIKSVDQDSKKLWGKMNVNQMICHLADQLRMAMGEVECRDKSTFFSRTFVKYLAVNIIDAPPEKVKTVHELDQERGGTKATEIENDKQILIAKLEKFVSINSESQIYPHGVFGKLSKKEWGKLIYKHLDHHLKQFSN
ncbi:MAG: DUF1569 domain-containing protein [Bacteroidia bacterium]